MNSERQDKTNQPTKKQWGKERQIFYQRFLQQLEELDCLMLLRDFSKEYEYYHLQIKGLGFLVGYFFLVMGVFFVVGWLVRGFFYILA